MTHQLWTRTDGRTHLDAPDGDVTKQSSPAGPSGPSGVAGRLADLNWRAIETELDDRGFAETPPVLSPGECRSLVEHYGDQSRFRSRVEMARHRFGEGDYQYFARPLPTIVEQLRTHAYPRLASIANRWYAALGIEQRFPESLQAFLGQCAHHGQTQPTPLLLHYAIGGYNCLHQDLYGKIAFPLQMLCFLGRPGIDYEGGAFVLVEQRPRVQSVADVVTGTKGGLVFFPTRIRPVRGKRGYYGVKVRHGVSRVRGGERFTLGVIFHDAT